MVSGRRVCLQFVTSINSYVVTVYDGERFLQTTLKRKKDCVCLLTCSPCIRIVVSPIGSEYNERFYFNIDTRRVNCITLYCNFNKRRIPQTREYRFLLTDRNYGIRLNGNLYFNKL